MSAAVATSGKWTYRAVAADGATVLGDIDAASEREAIDALRRRSLWVVAIELSPVARARGGDATSAHAGFAGPALDALARRTHAHTAASRIRQWFGADDASLAIVVRAVATLVDAGVPLHRALEYAATEGDGTAQPVAFAVVREAVERGESLSRAVAAQPQFPPLFAPVIAAGEASGTLGSSLAMLADHVERRAAVRAQLRSALVYPAILAVASIVGVTVILTLVVPRFATLVVDSGGVLPLSTRALVAVSALLTRGWWLLLAATAIGALVIDRAARDPGTRRRFDAFRLRWPVVGRLERVRAAAAYGGTLAIALRAGVSLLSAMALARAVVGNQFLGTLMADAERRVHAGDGLAQSLDGVLPPLTLRLLAAGESSGDLAGMASRAALSSEAELQRAVSRSVALIEPAMILGFGGIVGFVALALLQAIYGLNAGMF